MEIFVKFEDRDTIQILVAEDCTVRALKAKLSGHSGIKADALDTEGSRIRLFFADSELRSDDKVCSSVPPMSTLLAQLMPLKDHIEQLRVAADAGDFNSQFLLGSYWQVGFPEQEIPADEQSAYSLFKSAAGQCHPGAERCLGLALLHGQGTEKCAESALKWLRAACDHQDAIAAYQLGYLYEQGDVVPADSAQAFQYFKLAAELGHIDAQCNVGAYLMDGIGVEKDPVEALKWYECAARQGDTNAQYHAGYYHENGIGVPEPNLRQAFKWFARAAEGGHIDAGISVARAYLDGAGIEVDHAEAVRWLQWAAELDTTGMAEFHLSECYQNGCGVPADANSANELLNRSARKGYVKAQSKLGHSFLMAENYEEALKWLHLASEQDDPESNYHMGYMHREGLGIDVDEVTAFDYFRRASTGGHIGATTELGTAFLNGHGVDVDEKSAIECFERAAAENHTNALFNLGLCLERGYGTAKDANRAFECFERAAEMGNTLAKSHAGRALVQGRGIGIDNMKGLTWLREAADCDEPSAIHTLGICYQLGLAGLPRSWPDMFSHFLRAANLGHRASISEVVKCYVNGRGVEQSEVEARKWLKFGTGESDKPPKAPQPK